MTHKPRNYLPLLLLLPFQIGAQEQPWSATIATAASTNAYQYGETDNARSLSLDIIANYKIATNQTLTLLSGVSQDLDDGKEDGFSNSWIFYKNAAWKNITPDTDVSYRFGLQLPTSEYSNKTKKYAALRAELPMVYSIQSDWLKGWNFGFTPRLTRNFYERTTPIEGSRAFVEIELRGAASLSGDLANNLSASINGYFRRDKPFDNGWRSPRYGLGFDLSYSLPEDFSVSAGFSNQGALYDSERGDKGDVSLIDREGTEFYLSLEKSL
ncbi:transporter [Pelagibaculum spongiae]|uniref:Uncharacterized protein n=1 Tax=Pelagibaculum spongiae TaxID=2080658 RepID=A0A2V1H1K6_9GAMM|nr:transporter [Pelagibaculum spongiae]PVZ70261.1 hypothetical protein DC094_06590 [Pelagibaculum spongiae]